MKSLYLAIFIYINSLCYAQYYQYPKMEMVQSVRYSGNIYNQPANLPFKYFGDTMICGNVYSRYCSLTGNGTSVCGTGNFGALTRMVGSQVYVVYGPCDSVVNEALWYDWGLNVGSYFTVFPGNFYSCNVVVDSVYYKTMLNGQQRKYFRLHGSNWQSSNNVYRWIEGIGDIDNGFFGNRDFEGGRDIFVCHSENDTLIWQASNSNLMPYCHFQTLTGLNEAEPNHISIFPNPVNSILNIVDQNNELQSSTIKIKNLFGQVVFTSPFISQINISILSPGVYFLSIQKGQSLETVKIIKD